MCVCEKEWQGFMTLTDFQAQAGPLLHIWSLLLKKTCFLLMLLSRPSLHMCSISTDFMCTDIHKHFTHMFDLPCLHVPPKSASAYKCHSAITTLKHKGQPWVRKHSSISLIHWYEYTTEAAI